VTAAILDTNSPPSVAEVRRIAGIASPVIRNLEITHCYARLAAAVVARTGEGANWCTFATWASRQAGRTIRGEDLCDLLLRRLEHGRELVHPLHSLWRWLLRHGLFQADTRLGRFTAELHTPFDAFERASDAVARGNKKVFEEIGLEFARYLQECPSDDQPESAAFRQFLDGLRPGEPPDGQRYLRQAFIRYERRRSEADPKVRAELAVLANLEIGLHEQTRLQPEIREALDAPVATREDLGRRTLHAVFPSAASWPAGARRLLQALLHVLAARAECVTCDLSREAITQSFMVLSLPGRILALGTHLLDPYPDELCEPVHRELAELAARFEPASESDDCGVSDWADLDQRMHYILHLFCAFHGRDDLFRPPFTEEQVMSFRRGLVPDGEL
jgi:hypothetical protein